MLFLYLNKADNNNTTLEKKKRKTLGTKKFSIFDILRSLVYFFLFFPLDERTKSGDKMFISQTRVKNKISNKIIKKKSHA